MLHCPIIIGGNHHNTLGVIRALGYKGIKSLVILVTEEQLPYVSYSQYISKCVLLKTKQEIVPYLLDYSKGIKEKSVIISCADFVTSELDNSYNALKDSFYLPTADKQGVCNYYMDEEVMAKQAQRLGIAVPQTWIVDSDFDITHIIFPCIVKPLASIYGSKNEGNGSYLLKNKGRRFLVQEFIDKQFEYQLIGCSLNHGVDIVIPGYSKCIRPCPGTNTGFLEYRTFDDFKCNLQSCKEFMRSIGYQGLFSLEFLRDKSGNDYFMEINMRNDGNAICVTGAGVNLPYIWYQYCIGNDYHEEISNTVRNIFVMPEFDDFSLLLKRKVSITQWLKDYKRTSTFMEYCKNDPKPYYVRKKQYLKHLLFRLLGK